jgi:hypothetical protein
MQFPMKSQCITQAKIPEMSVVPEGWGEGAQIENESVFLSNKKAKVLSGRG